MMHTTRNNEDGQTAVEYILMLMVVVAILFSVMTQVKGYLIADAGKCTPTSKSLVCSFDRALTFGGFKRFRVYR